MRRPTAKIFIPVVSLALIAGLMVCPTSPAGAQAGAKLDDPTIVAIFDAANTYDIETGSLAATKGNTKAVRDFGPSASLLRLPKTSR